MLDVHPPRASTHTWTDFFIHIATIVIGLCIAVGLEQIVEFFHHRHQVAEIRETLRAERTINAFRFSVATEEFYRFFPKLQTNLAIFRYLQRHPGASPGQLPGKMSWYNYNIPYHTDAWEVAQRSGVLEYMPREEVRQYWDIYAYLGKCMSTMERARDAKYEAARFANVDPDPAHLPAEQIAREIELTSETLLRFGIAANAQRNLFIAFDDFKPAPKAEDIQRVSGIQWDEKETIEMEDERRRISEFEKAHSGREAPPN